MPDGDDAIVHYAPGDRPLCGSESMTANYTDDPALVAGCPDCPELTIGDLWTFSKKSVMKVQERKSSCPEGWVPAGARVPIKLTVKQEEYCRRAYSASRVSRCVSLKVVPA